MKKFRVWSVTKEGWLNSIVLCDDGTPIFQCESIDVGGKIETKVFTIDVLKPVIQYSSGMKDKNGKEIYEGDIVEFNGERSFVMFAYGTFLIDGHGEFYDFVKSLTPDRLEDWIVIGNIFENKDLIK